jgi:hypothetical protein
MTAAPSPLLLSETRQQRFVSFVDRLHRVIPRMQVLLNRNRRLLVSLRLVAGRPVLSIHEQLLDHPDALADLIVWAQRGTSRYT